MPIDTIPLKTILMFQEGQQIGPFIGLDLSGDGFTVQDQGNILRISFQAAASGIEAENDGVALAGGPFGTLNLIGGGLSDGGGGVLDMTPAIIFDGGTTSRNLRTTRANRSAMVTTKNGIVNLGTDTAGVELGATEDYAFLVGDQCSATATHAGAGGFFTVASGIQSFAWGHTVVASGAKSACFGWLSSASGAQSFAAGFACAASQQSAIALGYGAAASGFYSASIGNANTASGFASFAANYINVASGLASAAFGEANVVAGAKAISCGEDNVVTVDGESAAAFGHFNEAAGRASFIGGGLICRTTSGAVRSSAGGVAARASRATQQTWASGAFTDNQEGLPHLPAAGEAQTFVLVLRGETPGSGAGESVVLRYGHALQFFELEDDRAYTIEASVVASGIIGGVDTVAYIKRTCIAKMRGGTATMVAQGALDINGDAAAVANWTISFSATGAPTAASLNLTFDTGATTAWTRVVCRLKVEETIFPAAPVIVPPLTPNTGAAAGGTTVVIAGTGFVDGATVTFGGVAATGVVLNFNGQITCVTPAHAAGAVDVVVTNPDGHDSGASGAGAFTYT